MKIRKGEFVSKLTSTQEPEMFIQKVIEPFQYLIKNREINVHMIRKNDFNQGILKADWKNFQLAIFNIIQNGIKYNQFKGDLMILLKLKKKNKSINR